MAVFVRASVRFFRPVFFRGDCAVASLRELVLRRRLVRTVPRRARRRQCRGHVSQERLDAIAIFSMSTSKCLKRAPARFR